ncbi:hypothetical protein [Vibrio metschnikovii]|uniref:hypothetical protein n=1 Tax=Vibrio metschnikovii TaxID=28172 RepID=UPI001C30165F|nr:hypothetical protein [Vibrio metschnikovii]
MWVLSSGRPPEIRIITIGALLAFYAQITDDLIIYEQNERLESDHLLILFIGVLFFHGRFVSFLVSAYLNPPTNNSAL